MTSPTQPYPHSIQPAAGAPQRDVNRPVVMCDCGVANRLDARFCRGCRKAVRRPQILSPNLVHPGKPSRLGIPGLFRQAPVATGPWLHFHNREGMVLQLAPQHGAEASPLGVLSLAGAGFNRASIRDVVPQGNGAIRGWTYLVAAPGGLEALSLETGRSQLLYRARPSEPISANCGEADCQKMRGVAAGKHHAFFVVASAAGTRTLMSIELDLDRPPQVLMSLEGSDVAGPLLVDRQLIYCTERQVGSYCPQTGAVTADFPRWFEPMLAPRNGDLNVAPGGLPLAAIVADGPTRGVLVAGQRKGSWGLLQFDFDSGRTPVFRDVPPGSCLSTQPDGSACLCTDSTIEVLGAGSTRRVSARLKSWMPASIAAPFLIWFEDHPYAEMHKLKLDWSGQQFRAEFEDRGCTWENCCGSYVIGEDLVVCFLDLRARENEAGLKLVRWSLTGKN